MDQILINSILATIIISLLSLIGVITFFINKKSIAKISICFVAFSTGALIGGAFLHLLPEAIELSDGLTPFIYLILGLSVFFVLERYLKWHHCHDEAEHKVHTFTYMSLIGDGLHNFIDGLVVVSAFAVNRELGIITAFAVAAHELPQELGDFGLLIHGGLSRAKALFWNFVSSLTAIAGAVVGYFMVSSFNNITSFLLPFAAGGFVYIAMSDLIPELHKEPKMLKSIINFLLFAFGILFMLFIKVYFGD
ncbi:MAG: zinc and cadmium transporter [Patescibacteria group bacterium]|nr:zinc and cadmium transporter [Patescibacteria group bacterium]